MKELLQQIRAELERISPKHLRLRKMYATQEEIAEFEKRSGLTFPEELVEFWLGCDFEITTPTDVYKALDCESGPSFFMFDEFEYLVAYWEENAGHDVDAEFAEGSYFHFEGRGFGEQILTHKVFDKAWFPLATDSFDGAICIDLHPGSAGTHGQLLYMLYAGDGRSGPYYSGYASLTALLEDYLRQLKAGKTVIEDHIIYPLSHY